MAAMHARMRKEVAMLETDPPYGVSAWPKDGKLDELEAQIMGPDGSPYEKGVFRLEIEIPERYPFEPPKVRFTTPIYHPNIDDAGRICLDTLKMQPKGSWMPSVNISTLLTTIRLLMAEPNADDGLMPEIADMFKHNREFFNRKAAEMTALHARPSEGLPSQAVASPNAERPARTAQSVNPPAVAQGNDTAAPLPKVSTESDDDSFSDGESSSDDEAGGSDDDQDKQIRSSKRQRRS